MEGAIDYFEVAEALAAFRRLNRAPRNKNTTLKFFAFLGLPDEGAALLKHGIANEEAKARLQWIRGPNAKALYKAWMIRNDRI